MITPFNVVWQQDNVDLEGSVTYPVTFPGTYSAAQRVTLRTSARDTNTLEIAKNVKLYLVGSDVNIVQMEWPYLGTDFTPERAELNGGMEISFDDGRSYIRFDTSTGLFSDPSSWIALPAVAVGLNGVDGQLGPFDTAHLVLRYRVPPQTDTFKILDIQLAVDFDVV